MKCPHCGKEVRLWEALVAGDPPQEKEEPAHAGLKAYVEETLEENKSITQQLIEKKRKRGRK